MRAKQAFLTIAHRLAVLAYIAFALFPLFWLLKVAVTPNDLLYSEGIRLWPSRASLEHFDFVLRHSAFPVFFRNSLIVSGRPPSSSPSSPRSPATRSRASGSAANTGWSR